MCSHVKCPPNDIQQPLVENGHLSSLARIYRKKNDQPALIELYVKVADSVWKEESISDPVGKVRGWCREVRIEGWCRNMRYGSLSGSSPVD